MRPANILVVEDEGVIARDLQNRLKKMGYSVPRLASSGKEAIKAMLEIKPDIILMDIKLNGEIDGIETAGRIREKYDTPIIYITAYADNETLKRAKVTEPYGYIIKPFDDRELHSIIEMALYKSELDRKLKASEERFRILIENQTDFIIKAGLEGRFIFINPSFCMALDKKEEDLISTNFMDGVHEDYHKTVKNSMGSLSRSPFTSDFEIQYQTKGGLRYMAWAAKALLDNEGKAIAFVATGRDITERKQMERALKITNELIETERALLNEKNIALREILNQIGDEKKQIQTQIQSNIDRVVMPILEKLESKVGKTEESYISLLRDSLKEIASPFVNKLETQFSKLTLREVEICNMVKTGLTSKEIASMLYTSEQTIRKQRKNIRRKLGISNDKTNLGSFLQTL